MHKPARFTLQKAALALLLCGTAAWPGARAFVLAAPAEAVTGPESDEAAEAAMRADLDAAWPAAGGVKEDIMDINSDVKAKRRQLESLSTKEKALRAKISAKSAESASLEDELGLLENRIAKQQLDIDIASDEIRSIGLEIGLVDEAIKVKEAQVVKEQQLLGALARKLYRTGFHRTALDVMLSHDSLSDYFDELRRLTDVQKGVDDALVRVRNAKGALVTERASRESKRMAMEERKAELLEAKDKLEEQRVTKDALLTETKSSELEFRYLLADLKREQAAADADIQSLERSLREKVNIADRLKGQDTILSWPVPPTRGVSTRFHDPDYPFRYVYEHPGLDIRAYQSTAVRSSAAGIVARAKNAGMGYSYVMIIHNGEISTVYGHLSKIVVKEDAFVDRGEIIGYSGGQPGTAGAGKMTTGPHLHFETRLNGIPQDPMKFLVAF